MSAIYKSLSDEDLKTSQGGLPPAGKSSLGKLKAAIAAAFIFSLIALSGAAYLYQQLANEKSQRQALEASQIQIREKAESFQVSSQKSQSEINRLLEQMKIADNERTKLKQDLAASKSQIADLRKKMLTIEARAKSSSEGKTAAESPLPPTYGPAPTTAAVAKNNLVAAPAAKTAAASASATKAPAEPAAKPQILTVNRKFNFAVVSLGIKDNLKIGDVLEVVRGDKAVALLNVEKLYANFAAAGISNETKGAEIKEGDIVRLANPKR